MYPLIQWGHYHIPTFFLVISLSITALVFWFSKRLSQSTFKFNFDKSIGYNLMSLILITGLLGARLFHIFIEEPGYYYLFPTESLKIWKGGFVFYGGFITALITAFIYLHQMKQDFIKWANFLTPLLSLGYILGRLGCFLEGCCYGSHCDLPWAVSSKHPTQIYMLLAELLLFIFILKKERQSPIKNTVFIQWLLIHSLTRFIIEFYRADYRGSLYFNLISFSQVISIIITLFATYYLYNLSKKS